jgi:hypothetical protein
MITGVNTVVAALLICHGQASTWTPEGPSGGNQTQPADYLKVITVSNNPDLIVMDGTVYALTRVGTNLFKFGHATLNRPDIYVSGSIELVSGRLIYQQGRTDAKIKATIMMYCQDYLAGPSAQ